MEREELMCEQFMLEAFITRRVLSCPVSAQTKLYIPAHIHAEVVIRPSEMSRSVCSAENAVLRS